MRLKDYYLKPRFRHHWSYRDYHSNRYKNVIKVNLIDHWLIHCPMSFFMGGIKLSRGNVKRQNSRARKLHLEWLLGFPNPVQRLYHNMIRFDSFTLPYRKSGKKQIKRFLKSLYRR